MAVASWMLRNRTLRSGRFERSRRENEEDAVKIDLSKDARDNCYELLEGICRSAEVSEGKRMNYLNSLVKLLIHVDGNLASLGFSTEDILRCLRVPLVHQSTQVRAGGIRAVRHLLCREEHVLALNELQYPQLIARSLDVVLRNEIERIQALKLIRRALALSPAHFAPALARSLVSLANGVTEEKDRMLRACLAALCELALLNAPLFIACGGVTAVTRNILDCQMPRIVECLCGVLLHLLANPETRREARVDLHCLAAPYCDFHYRHAWMDKNRDERELRFNCSRLALLSVLRSWPGIIHFCSPRNASGLQAVVQVLYLNQLEVRKAVLDLLYELLGLPQPDWTDEYSVALNAVDPADPQDGWRLAEGFVVAEARSVVPHLARCTPNIAEIHLAVLLHVFLEVGLLGALVEVIVSSDTFISVRACVLLGELLHLTHSLLPPECCDVSPALPGLLAGGRTQGHHQALAAVTALNQLHALLKRRPASSSLYLDHILRAGRRLGTTATGERTTGQASASKQSERRQQRAERGRIYRRLARQEDRTSASPAEQALRESGVLHSKEGYHTWNWEVIAAILRRDGDLALRLDDSNHRLFLRRLVHYYQPSSNRYSHLDVAAGGMVGACRTSVGCELVRRLLAMPDQPESTKLLQEWFSDVSDHVEAISSSKSAHDCLFSPQHMATTLCHTYFLFIGHMCHCPRGFQLLKECGIFDRLMSLATTTAHACYVKLVVSSFDYAEEGPHREILAAVLACKGESSRLYATQFLVVLLRASLPGFERWGLELLVRQLKDSSRAVRLAALAIAHEACERRTYLERLVELRPDLGHLGDKGHLLHVRLLGTRSGYRSLGGANHAAETITRWADRFSYRYVQLVEAELLDSLTLHQRAEDGRYDRRQSSGGGRWPGGARRDVFVPPHLYGQLARHELGWAALEQSGKLSPIAVSVVTAARVPPSGDKEILEAKAALWACGHVAASALGVDRLVDDGVFAAVVQIAERSPVYSLRGTAVYVLGLMATTFRGANELFSLGWACVRHGRHERWPVVEEEDWSREPLFCREEDARTTASSGEGWDGWADEPIGRCSTLPGTGQAQAQAQARHTRSLSESHRHRDNSCTESTVSSCDSALGTVNCVAGNNNNNSCRLSPIPSSSSLSAVAASVGLSGGGTGGCWTADCPRRVSLSTHSRSDSTSLTVSPPDPGGGRLSHQDLLGYSTLRTLRRARAPSFRSDGRPREDTLLEDALFGLSAPGGGNLPPARPQPASGQCYRGICLPRQLSRLFPDPERYPTPSRAIARPEHSPSACLLCGYGPYGDLHPKNERSPEHVAEIVKQYSPYGDLRAQTERSPEQEKLATEKLKHVGDFSPYSDLHVKTERSPENEKLAEKLKQYSPYGDLHAKTERSPEHEKLAPEKLKHVGGDLHVKPEQDKLAAEKVKHVGSYSPYGDLHAKAEQEKLAAEKLKHVGGPYGDLHAKTERSPEHEKLVQEILKHVERLSNPVWSKQSKQALLHLKQRHSVFFQDVCLYSQVCAMVASTGYRLGARRFLQELFLDLDLDALLADQNQALRKRLFDRVTSPSTVVVSPAVVTRGFSVRDPPRLTCSENKFPITQRPCLVKSPEPIFRSFSGTTVESLPARIKLDDT